MNKKNILMLNYEFPPVGGGASPVSYEIAKGYVDRGHAVTVVTMHYRGLKKHEFSDGIEIYRVASFRHKKEICQPHEMLSYLISAKFFLKKHLKNNSYDINHTHFIIPTGIVSLWAKKKFGIPYIITSHGSDVPGYNTDRFKFLHVFTKLFLKRICKHAKVVVSPSEYLKKLIEENISVDNTTMIPNGIYIDKFIPKKKKKMIISTGRLLERKGFQYLIEAVLDKNYGYEVHIAGDGPMMGKLKGLAKNSKTKIVFLGWVDNNSQEYKNLLEGASIYILVSEKENASIALLEAMSAGCAIITSNVSGCPETIGDSGIAIEPKNKEKLKNSIEELIENKSEIKKKGDIARKRVESIFNWNEIIKKYEDLL